MKKKTFISLVSTAVIALSLTACSSTSTSGNSESSSGATPNQGKLVVVSWGGDYQNAQHNAMFEPYKKTGVQLVEDSPVNIGKIKSMVEGGNVQWDVVDVLGQDIPKLTADNLLEPINYNTVDKSNLLDSAVNSYSVDIDYYSTVLSYNKNNLPNNQTPLDWKDFFDLKKFPGSRALYKSPITTLEVALLADGVDPKKLYPLDIDRAFKKLDTIKSKIVWWDQGAQAPQLLSDKEVAMAAAWNGRIAGAAQKGQPLAFTYQNGILDAESWVVPKGAKNKDIAMKFVNFASQPEQQANLLKVIPYGPTNKKAFDFMDKEYAKTLPTYPDNLNKQVHLDVKWWHDHFQQVNDRFQAWLIK